MTDDAPADPQTIESPADLNGAPMSAHLGFDHPCLECDYNLIGLSIESACPECGAPVVDSLKKRLLRHAEPKYVRKLRSGARCVTLSAVVPLVGFCVAIPISVVSAMSGFSGTPITTTTTSGGTSSTVTMVGNPTMIPVLVQSLFSVITWALFAYGWFRLTSKDPDRQATAQGSSVSGACRWLAVAVASLLVIGAVFGIYGSIEFGRLSSNASTNPAALAGPTAATTIGGILSLIAYLALFAQFILGIKVIKRLTPRIPANGLTHFASLVLWFTIWTFGAYILLAVLLLVLAGAMIFPGSGSSAIAATGGAVMILLGILIFIASLAMIAAYVLYVILHARLWAHLSKACKMNPA